MYPLFCQTLLISFFGGSLFVGAGDGFNNLYCGFCPSYSIDNNLLNIFVVESGIAFVTWLEIENLAQTSGPAATRTENFAA
jgi:hypothetical protein